MRVTGALILLAACSGGGDAQDNAPGTGSVVIRNRVATDVDKTQVVASFSTGEPDPGSSTDIHCTTSTVGPCTISGCQYNTRLVAESAGTLTITGGTQPFAVQPDTNNRYSAEVQPRLFDGGELLTVDAQGATAPPFSQSIVAPTQATITAPAKPAPGSPWMIDTTQPLTVTWTGGAATLVHIGVYGQAGTYRKEVGCDYAGDPGSATLTVDVLANMKYLPVASISVRTQVVEQVTLDDWSVAIETGVNAIWPDGSEVYAPLSALP